MPIYNYIATDHNGNKKNGTVDARTEYLAVSLLKSQGFFVISINERRGSLLDFFANLRGVSTNEVVAFTRQFSTMISAGLPVSRALEVLADQASNNNMKAVLHDCLRDVEGGSSISSSMSRYPKVFSPTYQALVKAGESSGKLDEILKRLATTLESERELTSKFKSAMIYPSIVMIAMVGVFIMLMTFVVPRLSDMYKSLNIELPLITRVMIGISDAILKFYPLMILIIVGLFFVFKTFTKTKQGSEIMSVVAFNIPVFGKINKQKQLTDFTRTLSLLIASAIPIVEALNIVSQVVTNDFLRKASLGAAKSVEKGNPLSEFFKSDKNFPMLIGQMAAVGEETGQLDTTMSKVADYFQQETDNAVVGLSAALEPIILIVLGSMVGTLIISIITPIYKITSAL